MKLMSELKPCPFCGREVKIVEFSDGSGHIECPRCPGDGWSWRSFGNGKEQIINSWNRRVVNE